METQTTKQINEDLNRSQNINASVLLCQCLSQLKKRENKTSLSY